MATEREKEIEEEIETLQGELQEIQDDKVKLKSLDEFSNEQKVKIFEFLYHNAKNIAKEVFVSKEDIDSSILVGYMHTSMKLFFGENIHERFNNIINDKDLEE